MSASALTLPSMAALFGAMALLAALPSVSVLAVTARAAGGGFAHGALTALGVVAGDVVFIVLAIFGLSLLVDTLGGLFYLIQILGGVYLLWIGYRLWHARAQALAVDRGAVSSYASSFMTGLLITLADQKAVLFYLGFFPAFVDLATIGAIDVVWILLITLVAVGGVKLLYAYAAGRAGQVFGAGVSRLLNRVAAVIMASVGCFLIARALMP